MFRHLKAPTSMTKIGWGLVAALLLLRLLPWVHVAITVGAVILAVALLVVIYLATTRPLIDKVVTLPIADIGAADRGRFKDELEALCNEIGVLESATASGARLELQVRTDRDVASIHRLIKRLLKKSVHIHSVGGRLEYSALAPTGAAEVRLSGQVTPGAEVHIPGVEEPVVADDKGRFSQEVPFAAVKKYASHGKIRATYTHQGKERHVDIDLGA